MKRIRSFTIPDGMTFREFKEQILRRRKIRVRFNRRTIKSIVDMVRHWRQFSQDRRVSLGKTLAQSISGVLAGWTIESTDGFTVTIKERSGQRET